MSGEVVVKPEEAEKVSVFRVDAERVKHPLYVAHNSDFLDGTASRRSIGCSLSLDQLAVPCLMRRLGTERRSRTPRGSGLAFLGGILRSEEDTKR